MEMEKEKKVIDDTSKVSNEILKRFSEVLLLMAAKYEDNDDVQLPIATINAAMGLIVDVVKKTKEMFPGNNPNTDPYDLIIEIAKIFKALDAGDEA